MNWKIEDAIRSIKGRLEDGSGSNDGDEEDQDPSDGINIYEYLYESVYSYNKKKTLRSLRLYHPTQQNTLKLQYNRRLLRLK